MQKKWRGVRLILAWSCALFFAGCASSGKPASARFASVVIHGNTPGQIGNVAIEVFRVNGYEAVQTGLTSLVFEKEAKGLSNFTYGNWANETPLFSRVRVRIVPVDEGTFRIECQAYMVRDRRSSIEEEIKLSSLKRHPFQAMMDKVAQRLRPAAGTPH